MIPDSLQKILRENGYLHVREMPDGKIAAISQMMFTWGLVVGIEAMSYERRYCYEYYADALKALQKWDGRGDPSGPWIKEKPSDRLGPGAVGEYA